MSFAKTLTLFVFPQYCFKGLLFTISWYVCNKMLLFAQVFLQYSKPRKYSMLVLSYHRFQKQHYLWKTPHSSSSLEAFNNSRNLRTSMSMQIKECVLLICSDSFRHYQISQGIVSGSTLRINSLISEEGGESLFVYRGIKLCRFSSGWRTQPQTHPQNSWQWFLLKISMRGHVTCRGGKMRIWNSHCAASVVYLRLWTGCVCPWCVVFIPVVLEAILGFLNG